MPVALLRDFPKSLSGFLKNVGPWRAHFSNVVLVSISALAKRRSPCSRDLCISDDCFENCSTRLHQVVPHQEIIEDDFLCPGGEAVGVLDDRGIAVGSHLPESEPAHKNVE